MILRCIILLFVTFINILQPNLNAFGSSRFVVNVPCSDDGRHCMESGERVIDGMRVTAPCWKYGYTKTCNYPSKNDCMLYEHCYDAGTKECLLRDFYGDCVNIKKEFSCESWEQANRENKKIRTDLVAKDGEDSLVCSGIPCIDGNCIDKSYLTNGEMMDSVSKLYAASYASPDSEADISIFAGSHEHCTEKALSYSNCCGVGSGWGKNLGAKCSSSEKALMEMRGDKLCISVGQEKKGVAGMLTKRYFCCFSNLLEKAVQEQGRAQLGLNFGNGGNANCRGLTIDEIQRLDFSKIDFSEFINALKVKFTGSYKNINSADIKDRIEDSIDIRKYDNNPYNPENNKTGLQNEIINQNTDEGWDKDHDSDW